MRGCSLGSAIPLVYHQLQAVTVGVAEIDATVLARAAGNGDAVFLQFSPERIIRPRGDVESQMIEIVTGSQRGITDLFEQSHALTAGVQKHLLLVLPVWSHTKDLGVELFRALHVIHMQDDMVDPGRLDHRFLHLPVRLPLRQSVRFTAGIPVLARRSPGYRAPPSEHRIPFQDANVQHDRPLMNGCPPRSPYRGFPHRSAGAYADGVSCASDQVLRRD